VAQDALARVGHVAWSAVQSVRSELQASTQVIIDRAQQAGSVRPDFSAADIPMLMCGVSATMSSDEWDWRRHLEFMLNGLRSAAPVHKPAAPLN
jgi:hypothetical protein